ncbi:PIG-L deacetylase family protein [Streptomyces celluloflavus]|uniref:PIG-L deacetylase family protein n=1 Tax=Streptomyces celluloflavus TaxID=58344 RepID=UPI00365B3802
MTRVLAVVAHPDDEVLGPGATLARHARCGDEVHVLILAEGKSSRSTGETVDEAQRAQDARLTRASRAETAAARAALGVDAVHRLDLTDNQLDTYPLLELARLVGRTVADVAPRIVYTHHSGDLNVDHELTARACMIACRPHVSGVRWLLGFATLSATDAGHAGRPPFVPAVYADIADTLNHKIEAMRAYSSELRDFPHPRSLEAIRAQARLFGAHANVLAAEAFSVLRGTWPASDPDLWSEHER